jgi:pimeloyl-ACP methyl ester carboxylesterase
MIVNLTHNKVILALHQLKPGEANSTLAPLLVLHGLGEHATKPPAPWDQWPAAIWSLEFTGHGQSSIPAGGGYTCEVLMSDVDIALAHLGQCTILGRGVGAYIALLVAGARPELTRGVVLADGPGLTGGGGEPTSAMWAEPGDQDGSTPDKHALIELSRDLRPPDYATSFLRLLMAHSEMETPLVVGAKSQPSWLAAVANEPGVVSESLTQAFDRYVSD